MEKERSFTNDRRYSNKEITVYWKPFACIHASYCYRELLAVFDPIRRPWVNMKGAPTEKIIETVDMCPTEALTWKWNDDEKNKMVGKNHTNHVKFRRPELMDNIDKSVRRENPVTVKIMTDGPVVITGNFTLKYKGNTKEIRETLISLCRCGKSDIQPFCDGSHNK